MLLDPLSINVPSTAPAAPVYPVRKLLQPSPVHPDDYILEIDYSSMSNALECWRRAENYSIHSREANKDNSPTDFGNLFHRLEGYRRLHGWNDETKVWQLQHIQDHFAMHQVAPTDHRTSDRMVAVMKLYYEKYANDGLEKKIYTDEQGMWVERPFKVELCTLAVNATIPYARSLVLTSGLDSPTFRLRNLHIVYTGRCDTVLTEGDALWVLDDKTSSRGGGEFFEWFRLSLQTRGYVWVVQKLLGRPVLGCILNAVIIRPLTKTGTGTEMERRNYFYSQDSLAEWEESMKAHVADFVSNLVRGYWPQTALSFKSPCSGCDYAENCTLPLAQRAADLASDLYRDVRWNPVNE